jgi:hypothetical protein
VALTWGWSNGSEKAIAITLSPVGDMDANLRFSQYFVKKNSFLSF